MANKFFLGFIVLVILTSSVYILLPENLKIEVGETKTTLKVYENNAWVLAGTEYSLIYSGSTKLLANSRDVNYSIFENTTTITRTANFKDNISVIDIYYFDGSTKDKELIPIFHKVIIKNAKNKIFNYQVNDLSYKGITKTNITSPKYFGHNTKVEWESGNYYSRIFKYSTKPIGKLDVKYRIASDYEEYDVKLFDPDDLVVDNVELVLGGDLVYDSVTLMNGGNITINQSLGYLNISATNNITINTGSHIKGDKLSNYSFGTGGAGSTGSTDCCGSPGGAGIEGNQTPLGGNGGGGGGTCSGFGDFSIGSGSTGDPATVTGDETGRYNLSQGNSAGGGGGGSGGCGTDNGCTAGSGSNGEYGGATIRLQSNGIITIDGIITSNGGSGGSGGGGCCGNGAQFCCGDSGGPGGAGGSGQIILDGSIVNVTYANLSASTASGAGGRIKVFSVVHYNSSTITEVSGTNVGTVYWETLTDETAPIVTIDYPLNNSYYNSNVTELNCTFYDVINVSSCWYSTNNWITNNSFVCGNNITGMNSTEGSNSWSCGANDTQGNIGFYTSTFDVDITNPTIEFRYSASDNDTWLNTSTIISNVEVNETYPSNITYLLFNITGIYNNSNFSMSDTNSNTTFSYVNVLDGNYTFNVTIVDRGSRANTTETRSVYVDTTYPQINYTDASDVTNISANFSIKNNIYVEVNLTELNLKNITYILWTSVNSSYNKTIFYSYVNDTNWTDLPSNMYFWNVTACDYAGNCNTTETRSYGVQFMNLSIDGSSSGNISVELGSTNLVAYSSSFANLCVDINHPEYGVNYSCAYQNLNFSLRINWFRNINFSDGLSTISLNYTSPNNSTFNISSHQYDEVVNMSVNISGEGGLLDLKFYKTNLTSIDREFIGKLFGTNINVQNFTGTNDTLGSDTANLSFSTKSEITKYVYMDDNAKLVNFTLNVTGFGL